MAFIVACLMAALSFVLNRAILRFVGLKAVITYSPVVEELAKTLLAVYLGADILLTHIVFGIIEAGYDWRTSVNHGVTAAALSIIGHGLFGLVTVGMLSLTGEVLPAIGTVILLHLAWNIAAIHFSTGERDRA